MDIIINILLNFKLIVGIISTRFIYISKFIVRSAMASGFRGKKKHRLNRKKYVLKRRRRKHEGV